MLGALPGAPCFDGLASSPVLPNDILQQAVPGNLRRADQFVRFLRRLVAHLLKRMVRPTGLQPPPHPPPGLAGRAPWAGLVLLLTRVSLALPWTVGRGSDPGP